MADVLINADTMRSPDGHGYPTQLTKEPGLEVHERTWMSRVGDRTGSRS